MFRIAIVDDDADDAATLQRYIEAYAQDSAAARRAPLAAHSVRIFASGDDFLASFPAEYDAVFLDIDMPGTSGMQAAARLRKDNNDAAIIFVTNMAKYALAGYTVRALDFIVKPVSYRDFALKFSKVIEYCRRNAARTLALRLGESEQVTVSSTDILYVEVIQHYLLYHMAGGTCYRVRGTIGEVEERLSPYAFARASKSFLVNLRHVRSINGQAVDVGGEIVYIGRTKRDTFLSEKRLECGAHGIRLTCSVGQNALSFMSPADVYVMVGNILDNAIEAVSHLEDTDRRVITLTCTAFGGVQCLREDNYFAGEVTFKDGMPVTSKRKDPGFHGYGVRSIRHIAEKYGGFLELRAEEGVFSLLATIPCANAEAAPPQR